MKYPLPLLLCLTACGGMPTPAEMVEPEPMTAADALEEPGADPENPLACREVGARDTPLIVDMKAMDRADIEEVMQGGVGVVAYDCKTIKLLPDCQLGGDYGFIAISKKEETVQLAKADDVAVNLPFSGAALVKAGYGRESSINLATVLVGKHRTTVRRASKQELQGQCSGATHYIRGAYAGAFAMKTGTIGKMEAAVDIFGVGASGDSSSSKKVDKKDGDPKACEQIERDAEAPPAECGALLRLELVALSNEAPKPAPAAPAGQPPTPPEEPPPTCPEGMVFTGMACMADTGQAHECNPEDAADCRAQCDKGHMLSCAHLGVLHFKGQGVARDAAKGRELMDKACAAGVGKGCNGLGVVAAKGLMGAPDLTKALEHYNQACQLGYMRACHNVGYVYEVGQGVPKDEEKAVAIYHRGCNGGLAESCMNLGLMIVKAPGTDHAQGVKLLERACYGGYGQACANAATGHSKGDGVPKDMEKAKAFAARACQYGYKPSCVGGG